MAGRRRATAARESGQAAVEAALTLPLLVFLVLGTMQLFLMMHARILTNYAAYRATRTGSVNHGNCDRMVQAALLAVMPSIDSYLRPGGGSPGAKLAAAFAKRKNNKFNETASDGAGSYNAYTGDIIWIVREQPRMATVQALGNQDLEFDAPGHLMRLETRVIYWYPMRIPFANWVMSKMFLAHYQLQSYTNQNPLLQTQTANWGPGAPPTFTLDAAIGAELLARANRKEYVFPIQANYTMRMMTPAKAVNFTTQNCPPTPAGL